MGSCKHPGLQEIREVCRILVCYPKCFSVPDDLHSGKLKADRPHPRNYPHMPTDHRHTDKHFRLVMTLLCSKQESAHRQMDGQTDGQTLPSTLSPSLRGR